MYRIFDITRAEQTLSLVLKLAISQFFFQSYNSSSKAAYKKFFTSKYRGAKAKALVHLHPKEGFQGVGEISSDPVSRLTFWVSTCCRFCSVPITIMCVLSVFMQSLFFCEVIRH